MRKTVLYTAMWLAAGAAAVALGTAGVSMVGNQVTGSRPSPLSAAEVRAELAADASTALTASTTTVPPGDPTASTTTTTPPTQSAGPTTTSAPRRPSQLTTTTAVPAQAVTRTYALIGGTVTLRFASTGVTVQDATPKPGYSVEIEPEERNGVKVEFRSSDTDHRSRVDGWWYGGPRDEVREEG